MNINFALDRPFALESPIDVVEGSSVTFRCTFWDDVTSVTAKAYRNGTEVTSTVFPAGSITLAGAVATLKPFTAFIGGSRYVIAVTGTVQSDVMVRKIEVRTSKDESEQ